MAKKDALTTERRASNLLLAKKARILEVWEQRVREQVPAAKRQDRALLRNSMPDFLNEIARKLSGRTSRASLAARIPKQHGEQRAQETEFLLEHVLLEYSILRQTIFDCVEADEPLHQVERDAILNCIDGSLRDAAVEFSRRQEESLRQADRRKNEFLAMLGHELRTPLSAASNALFLLQQFGAPDTRAVRQREILGRQLNQLLRLVDDLMNVSRIASGKIEIRKERVDLVTVVEDALLSSGPLLEDREHRVEVSVPVDPVWLEADPDRLGQVITNLLNNAARYTEPGGQIWLSLTREDQDAVVKVRDTGIGISREMLPVIFDVFTQGDSSAVRSRGGLGMGLTLAQRLVELHEGAIHARSEGPGKGSEFSVRLPLAAVPDPPAAASASPSSPARKRKSPAKTAG